jgi:hypothetical protein
MSSTYYLDESGSSGDVVKKGGLLESMRDPIFSLACIGLDDLEEITKEIDRLKQKHKVRATELKSRLVWEKPKFVWDLIKFVHEHESPVFIEVLEKRFLLLINMVQSLIMPPVGECDATPEGFFVRNAFAEFLAINAPFQVIDAYFTACKACSLEASRRAFDALVSWLRCIQQPNEVAQALLHMTGRKPL